ncbi:hypothetical protein LJC12_01965 [Odoribacter sp. OttesenSCG-928-J03]|nr:hypothetical protein [Odoribacter sp. OttesenSCG-928-J03]MDL2330704.1 hypothetical protein [Odoribacter sp. OttesenSCG-928-A06]
MKKMKFLGYLFLAVLCLGFVSCSDDDDDDTKNEIVYGSDSYDIHEGLVLNYGNYFSQGTYNLDLCLYTEGISFDEEAENFVGSGKMLRVYMWCESAELTAGIYTYDPDSNEDANTFYYLGIVDKTNEITRLAAGTVEVTKDGNIYTIVVTGTDAAGKTISAFYKGTLNKFEITVLV